MADAPHRAGSKRTPKSRARRVVGTIVRTLVIVVCVCVIGSAAAVVVGYSRTSLPDPNAEFQTQTSFVYYNDGKTKLGSFAIQNRTVLTSKQMPQNVKDAAVAAENRTFWTDPGISLKGILRSAWVILRGGDLQGGSTITQEYIKVLYLNSQQTVSRKIKELFLAVKLARTVPKDQILTNYLNTIYFGRGAYGIQAAAKAYFNTDASKLTTPQAAALVAIFNNPSIYDPSDGAANKKRLLDRYRYVIDGMAEAGNISAAEQAKDRKALPAFPDVPSNNRYAGPNGFLLKMVQDELAADGFSSQQINGGGLQITTTFDKKAQDAAVASAQKYTKESADAQNQKASNLHAAVASVDVKTGGVLALYGGPDYVKNSRNWATTPRGTGSTFKPYALVAGLQNGYSLFSAFRGSTFTPSCDTTPVRNEFFENYGYSVSLLRATEDSINTAFVDLTCKLGAQKVIDAAKATGVPERKNPGWYAGDRIVLGTADVSPLDQANAYATFDRGGTYLADHVVAEVKDSTGKVLYSADPKTHKAMDTDIARDVTYALSNVVEEGTGTSVRTIDRPAAGKTGTAGVGDAIQSAWFVGYTKQISTAVMFVAGDSGTGDLDPYKKPGDGTFFGGTYPAAVWADYMETATKGQPVEDFDPPAYVNRNSYPPPATNRPTNTHSAPPPTASSAPPSAPPSSAPPSKPPSAPPSSAPPSSAPPSSAPPSKPPSNPPTTEPPSKRPPSNPPTSAPPTKPPASNPPSRRPTGQADGGSGENPRQGGAGGGTSGG